MRPEVSSSGPIRRAQLISPVGVGALTVLPDGTSVIVGGLDHWYEGRSEDAKVDATEFFVSEWRLQKALGVSHFRLPPDFRAPSNYETDGKNQQLEVPVLRFPTWHFCSWCRGLHQLPLPAIGRRQCPDCSEGLNGRKKRKWAPLSQVPLVAICGYGHIQDFPWREWVHRSLDPKCDGRLSLNATGAASLAAQVVSCDCGAPSRNLGGTTELTKTENGYSTVLSRNLDVSGRPYPCLGMMPWNGSEDRFGCTLDLKASQRAASNLYYSMVRSSIYLPRTEAAIPEKLFEILDLPTMAAVIGLARNLGMTLTPEILRNQAEGRLLKDYSDEQVAAAVEATSAAVTTEGDAEAVTASSHLETEDFRRREHDMLRDNMDAPELVSRRVDLARYGHAMPRSIARVTLVERLRETRALLGFNRIYGESQWDLRDRKALLRRASVPWAQQWLPAYVVHGEGLFIELDPLAVESWAAQPLVAARVGKVARRFERARVQRGLRPRQITPRLVLVHTLAHALINQLTYESGYSSASLRERLYVSDDIPMNGVLIYTAAGDAEGTMGGLVRMGRAGNLERVIAGALESAQWCSTDPVCMEVGEEGQGPDGCNMAACYGCVLVPETACEEFNRFLDRAVLVGTLAEPGIGFFTPRD